MSNVSPWIEQRTLSLEPKRVLHIIFKELWGHSSFVISWVERILSNLGICVVVLAVNMLSFRKAGTHFGCYALRVLWLCQRESKLGLITSYSGCWFLTQRYHAWWLCHYCALVPMSWPYRNEIMATRNKGTTTKRDTVEWEINTQSTQSCLS